MKSDIEYEVIIENSRSPSWGAWIEMAQRYLGHANAKVAPPRGERGLKYPARIRARCTVDVAPPRGERGLKSKLADIALHIVAKLAPPRGERGLKSPPRHRLYARPRSLPLVGSVD